MIRSSVLLTIEDNSAADSVNPKDPAAAEEPVTPTEPEEVVKTLDEYLAEKANKNLKVTLPEARKANEGADDAKWKDAVAFSKVEEPEYLPAKVRHMKKRSLKCIHP
jgi:plasminogen activator inhibitor 1 RNA-binding protein